jgi:hypothetical protein
MIKESEKVLEKKIITATQNAGGMSIKLLSNYIGGLPDRLCLLPGGQLLFVEVKTTGEKPRPIQVLMHMTLRRLGFQVEVIDSSVRIKEVFDVFEIMKTLERFEIEMLHAIAAAHPFAIKDITTVYRRLKSFDNTIALLEVSTRLGIGCFTALNVTCSMKEKL